MLIPPDKYFGFLNDCGFIGPVEYAYTREIHAYYVKGKVVIFIGFDNVYWVTLIKTRDLIPELESGGIKVKDLDFREHQHFNLKLLDPGRSRLEELYRTNDREGQLRYYTRLIKESPEILDGELRKFGLLFRLLRKLGFNRFHVSF